ncbi:MAG: hypothetical protein WC869_00560 [Phycisphaerae bacterium]|jgi:hypothetical protein
MAIGDQNPFALNQSEQLLRDIRDELKTSRQTSGASSTSSGRPSPAFISAQQTVDRMVAGEWATLGWANAYQTSIKSSLANDLMGAMNLRAAPQSLWQREYETMTRSMLTDRIASFPADLIMPGFGRRSRDMGAQIYQLSSRFNRSGDNLDTNFHAAMNLGRDLQIGAATDMRLSGGDYSAIMQQSASAGQFDFAGGIGDVKTQFTELRNAVADLTKTMRLGAGEVAQTMGAFRQFGITDVADQKRMAERLAVSARVAGISTPEMAGIVRTGIENGMQLGLGAQGSAALAENLAMGARTASRSGLISSHVMAAAGGVQGMVQAQENAINQFAGSTAGFYTLLGGAAGSTGNALNDILSGIGTTGGTLGGIVAAESRRMDLMGGLSGGQRSRLFNRNIQQQMGMLGIDPNSAEATDYAFSLVRGQMGDAAGLAYARQNFSAEGRRQRWADSFRTEMGVINQGAQRDYQLKMENETMFGQVRQMTGQLGAGVAGFGQGAGRVANWVGRQVGGWFSDSATTFGNAVDALNLNGDDALSAEAAAGASMEAFRSSQSGNSREQKIRLTGSVTTSQALLGNALSIGGGLGGAYFGAKIGAGIGTFGGPIGTIVGGLLGAGVGYMASGLIAGHAKPNEMVGDEASNYLRAFQGSTGGISQRASNIANGNEAQVLNALSGNQAFKQLIEKSSRGKLSDSESREMARLAGEAGKATGVSTDDVMGVARSLGVDMQMQDSYNSASSGAKRYEKTMMDVMDGVESSKLSIASSEVASGVQSYAKAVNDTERNKARAQLTSAGITGRGMDNLLKEVDSLDTNARNQLASDASDYVSRRGSTAVNKRLSAFNRVAENLASEAGAMNQAGGMEAYNRIKELEKDPQAIMDVVMGRGDPKDAALRDLLIRQDDTGTMGKLKELGSIEDLMATSSDDKLRTMGLSPETLKTLRDKIGENTTATPAQKSAAFRSAAATMLIGQSSAVKQASDPTNVAANNMLLAANILREIQSKISTDTSTKGKK